MAYEIEKNSLPMFPKTAHLPIEPNTGRDDLIVSESELDALCASPNAIYEEKLDGASTGITVRSGQLIIRNRLHILSKGFSGAKTPAKQQFAAIWGWYYDNRKLFSALEKSLGFTPSVYGEWLLAKHTIPYDSLPSFWIAYDIYNAQKGEFISPILARELLIDAGFYVPPLLWQGNLLARNLWNFVMGIQRIHPQRREKVFMLRCLTKQSSLLATRW